MGDMGFVGGAAAACLTWRGVRVGGWYRVDVVGGGLRFVGVVGGVATGLGESGLLFGLLFLLIGVVLAASTDKRCALTRGRGGLRV